VWPVAHRLPARRPMTAAEPFVNGAQTSPSRASTIADIGIAVSLGIGAALLCCAAVMRRPDLNASAEFLFSDPGVNLLIAHKLSEGGRLYRDAGYSYGPLGIYPYEWFSRLFGITPQSFSAYLALLSVIGLVGSYALLRQHVSRISAVAVAVAGLYTMMLVPGSLIFGIQASGYIPLERLFFLGVLLCWRAPSERRPRDAAAVGVILGLWQGVRFGTTFFVGGAVVLVDLLTLYFTRAHRADLDRWFRLSLVTLGWFLVVEASWIAWAFLSLPASDAKDFLWPSYALDAFRVWPSERRWPRYVDIRLFVGQQLLPIACIGLGFVAIVSVLRKRTTAGTGASGSAPWRIVPRDCRLLLPLVFYLIAAAGLFRSVYHFHQYAWALALPVALVIEKGRTWYGGMFGVLALPALALMLRANLLTRPPDALTIIRPPRGGELTVNVEEARRIEALHRLATVPVARDLIIMPVGAGFHALFGTRDPSRQMFYILAFARGSDEGNMLRILASPGAAIVLTGYPLGQRPGPDPCMWYGWPHFRDDFCVTLAQSIDIQRAVDLDPSTWIIPSSTSPAIPVVH
jgi:hypothetical protein